VGSEEPTEELPKESKKALVMKLVIVPLLIVSVAIGVFLFFGWLTYDYKSAEEFLADIKTASAPKKWQAAFVLAGKLRDDQKKGDTERIFREMTAIFKNAKDYDEKVRSYMAMALGNLGDQRAVPFLEKAAQNEIGDVQIYSIWALGTLRSKSSLPLFIQWAGDADPAVRKAALFVLGSLEMEEAIPVLHRALGDVEIDIRWNAAIALAKLGDGSGLDVIKRLLDRTYYDNFSAMGPADKSGAMINALRAVAFLNEISLLPIVEEISRQDRDMQVRRAAHDVIHALKSS